MQDQLPAEQEVVPSEERDLPSSAKTRSRRSFLGLGALVAGATALRPAAAAAQKIRRAGTPDGYVPFQLVQQQEVPSAPASWTSTTTRLLRRATYGPTQGDRTAIQQLGYQGWLAQQLKPSRIPDVATTNAVAVAYPLLSGTPDSLYQTDEGTVAQQLQQATIYRAAFSERQLFERMVEFWSDHFNIYVGKVGYLKIMDDRDVIRKYALGRFGDLVKASAKSPAMLVYLDQTASRVGRTNENYARELMELHTLGVDGGYTQTDVSELARVLTGWTIKGRGDFNFDATGHDWTAKTVMGMTIPAAPSSTGAAGIKEGEKIIDMLVAHPNTAKFISRKMIRWLLNSEPTTAQVSTISGVYRATGGDITAMVRAILNDAWVAASPARYKRPFHFLVSGIRAVNATVTSTSTVSTQLNVLGQPLFIWDTPDGYPDSVEFWAGNITPRWQFGNTLANYKTTAITVDHTPYLASVDLGIEAMNQRVFAGEMSASTKASLRAYLAGGTLNETRVRETLGLAISASDFQWY